MNLRYVKTFFAGLVLCAGLAQGQEARPLVHSLFCDHAVLQRGVSVPIWGWAAPGAAVSVSFAGQTKSTVAGQDGKWQVKLSSLRTSTESRILSVRSGDASTNIQDVLVGDVWLCSGQSNMEMGIGACNVPDEIAQANYPNVRLLTVPKNVSFKPVELFKAQWLPCSPENIKQGVWAGFSAAGYFFGRKIHQETGVPIGLIHSSWGGTPIESWISVEALSPVVSMKERLDSFAKTRDNEKGGADPKSPNTSTVLYNGMIAPVVPFAIKGAIWYQGESNAGRAEQYRQLLPLMIQDWKTRFAVRQFPFYIVQLASFMPTNSAPRDSDWAELREAQAITAKTVKHAGLAVAIDIGDAKDIHPKNKMEVGRRLALCALADTYGKNVEFSGPSFRKLKVTDKGIKLRFDHTAGGLEAKGGSLTGFAIAGEDHKFVWATAQIQGDSVIVSSPAVPKPVAVRYAWDSNPVCNLYNQAGLPAIPFRTDDWPMVTHGKK